MSLVMDRRTILRGIGLAVAAPIIVQAANIMPVKLQKKPFCYGRFVVTAVFDGANSPLMKLQSSRDGQHWVDSTYEGKPLQFEGWYHEDCDAQIGEIVRQWEVHWAAGSQDVA